MTLEFYYVTVLETYAASPRWRVGQTAFNVLAEIAPNLAEQVRGTNLDPFHQDSRIPTFCRWLEVNWGSR